MNSIKKLLKNEKVEWKKLWEVTSWDKKFNGVEKFKQNKINKYHYYFSNDLKKLVTEDGNIKILTTNKTELYASEESVKNDISIGEIVCIPGGGYPIVQYYNGKFITGDNRIATSLDTKKLSNKFLYYSLLNKIDIIATFYRGSGIKHPDMYKILDLEIPIPSLETQAEIVKILDTFTELIKELKNELNLRKKQYSYYRDKLLSEDYLNKHELVENVVEWKKFGDIKEINVISPKKKIQKKEYLSEGIYPIIDQGQNYIIGYTNDKSAIFNKNSYIIFGDHTESIKYVDFEFAQGADGIKVLQTDENYLKSRYLFHTILNFYKKTGKYMRHFSLLKEIEIPIPSLEVQEKIVEILDTFTEIQKELKNELELRNKQYEYYLEKLLTFNKK